MVRCFVAVWPTPDVVSALAALPRPPLDAARWTTESQWHVTLRFFGDLSPADLESAGAALAAVAGSLPECPTAQGGPGTRFLGPGLIVWPVAGLETAAEAVEKATAGLGQPVPDRRFYGHMTIARGRRGCGPAPFPPGACPANDGVARELALSGQERVAPRRRPLLGPGTVPHRAPVTSRADRHKIKRA